MLADKANQRSWPRPLPMQIRSVASSLTPVGIATNVLAMDSAFCFSKFLCDPSTEQSRGTHFAFICSSSPSSSSHMLVSDSFSFVLFSICNGRAHQARQSETGHTAGREVWIWRAMKTMQVDAGARGLAPAAEETSCRFQPFAAAFSASLCWNPAPYQTHWPQQPPSPSSAAYGAPAPRPQPWQRAPQRRATPRQWTAAALRKMP